VKGPISAPGVVHVATVEVARWDRTSPTPSQGRRWVQTFPAVDFRGATTTNAAPADNTTATVSPETTATSEVEPPQAQLVRRLSGFKKRPQARFRRPQQRSTTSSAQRAPTNDELASQTLIFQYLLVPRRLLVRREAAWRQPDSWSLSDSKVPNLATAIPAYDTGSQPVLRFPASANSLPSKR